MKCRVGFVSNSSSSSFIVIGKEPEGVGYTQILNPPVFKKVAKRINVAYEDIKDTELFLTEFISDSSDIYNSYTETPNSTYPKIYDYSCGECGGSPYDEDAYIEIENNIFLLKEDSEDFYVSLQDLCASLAYFAVKTSSSIPLNLEDSLRKFRIKVKKSFKEDSERTRFTLDKLEKLVEASFKKVPEIMGWFEGDTPFDEYTLKKSISSFLKEESLKPKED